MNICLFPSIENRPDYLMENRKLDKDPSLLTLVLSALQLRMIRVGKTNLDLSVWKGSCRQPEEFQGERAKTEGDELYVRTEQKLSLGDTHIRVRENEEQARD